MYFMRTGLIPVNQITICFPLWTDRNTALEVTFQQQQQQQQKNFKC